MKRARSCILATCQVAGLLLTPGCMILGGLPPNTKTSESTVDYSNGYIKFGTRQTYEPYSPSTNSAVTNNVMPYSY